MREFFKKLLTSKIQINIKIVTSDSEKPKTELQWPSALVMPAPEVVKDTGDDNTVLNKNDFRFVSDWKQELTGKVEEYWYTEILKDGRWHFVPDSLAHNKNKALDLHLQIIERGTVTKPREIKTVLWERITNDQTKTWASLLKNESNK
ncbi:MAG TPA: hypothetical protein VFM18_17750 [Methanosarcina sp.]|nr:hypothetical protein [Methanosarcina sp.]